MAELEAVLENRPGALDGAVIAARAGAIPETDGREELAHAWRRARALAAQLDANVLFDDDRHEEALIASRAVVQDLQVVLAEMPPLDPQRPQFAKAFMDAGITVGLVPGPDEATRRPGTLLQVAALADLVGLDPADRAWVKTFVLHVHGPGPGGLAVALTVLEDAARVQAVAGRRFEELSARLALASLLVWLGDEARGLDLLVEAREAIDRESARLPERPELLPDGERAFNDLRRGVPGVLRRLGAAQLGDDGEGLDRYIRWSELRQLSALGGC